MSYFSFFRFFGSKLKLLACNKVIQHYKMSASAFLNNPLAEMSADEIDNFFDNQHQHQHQYAKRDDDSSKHFIMLRVYFMYETLQLIKCGYFQNFSKSQISVYTRNSIISKLESTIHQLEKNGLDENEKAVLRSKLLRM